VYVGVPPVPTTVADPFVPPLQDTEVLDDIVAVTANGWLIVTDVVAEQLFKSLTVTVKVPTPNPVTEALV
jgi:hypothetical protein